MIIALAGRQGSGKTLAAQEVINKGFKKISFADLLKELIAELYGFDLQYLYDPKKKIEILDVPLIWNSEKAKKLASLMGIKDALHGDYVEFETYRKAMQYIGTEVIRRYDYDYHVKETAKRMNKSVDYVFDDVRFKNELDMVKVLEGNTSIVVRPFYNLFNNHASEIQLRYKDFDNIFVNMSSKEEYVDNFKSYFGSLGSNYPYGICKYEENRFSKSNLCYDLDGETAYTAGVLQNSKFLKDKNCFVLSLRGKDILQLRDYSQKGILHIDDPFIVENFKLWDISQEKSKAIPRLFLENEFDFDIIMQWFKGYLTFGGVAELTNWKTFCDKLPQNKICRIENEYQIK